MSVLYCAVLIHQTLIKPTHAHAHTHTHAHTHHEIFIKHVTSMFAAALHLVRLSLGSEPPTSIRLDYYATPNVTTNQETRFRKA